MNKIILIESTAILAMLKSPDKTYLPLNIVDDIEWFVDLHMAEWLKSLQETDYKIHWAGFNPNSKLLEILSSSIGIPLFKSHENTGLLLEVLSRQNTPSKVALLSNFFPKDSRKMIQTGEATVLLCQTSPKDFDYDTVDDIERFLSE